MSLRANIALSEGRTMGFKAFHSASATLARIETVHMIRKGQFANNQLPAYQQFIRLLYSHVDNWQL